MRRFPGLDGSPRRKQAGALSGAIEALESRTLLDGGISAAAGPPIHAVAGVAITGAVFATFTITDVTGEPGTQWRALIVFGDGQNDRLVAPVLAGDQFEFLDSHTYKAPGTYDVTVMIAIPMSGNPTGNVVTTQVTVTAPTSTCSPTPVPSPSPTPPPSTPTSNFTASGLPLETPANRTFRRPLASFSAPGARAGQFHASIGWGDGSALVRGQVEGRGNGRFTVVGAHRFRQPGTFAVTVTIVDAAGHTVTAQSWATVLTTRERRFLRSPASR
jgi:hypothetical protein